MTGSYQVVSYTAEGPSAMLGIMGRQSSGTATFGQRADSFGP